jgi:hypothetical protein
VAETRRKFGQDFRRAGAVRVTALRTSLTPEAPAGRPVEGNPADER